MVSGVKSNNGTDPNKVIKETDLMGGAEWGTAVNPIPCFAAEMRGRNEKGNVVEEKRREVILL